MTEVKFHTMKGTPLVVGNQTFASAMDFELTEKDMKKAHLELHETQERRNRCLKELKERLDSDKDMEYLMDDMYLLRYLRCRKFDTDEAYKTIKHFYSLKIRRPEAFAISSDVQRLLDIHAFYYLPYVDEEGRIVFVSNFDKWNPDETPFMMAFAWMITVIDIVAMNPRCQINGIVSIWNMQGFNLRKASEFASPAKMMLFFEVLHCLAMRIKLAIAVNCDPLTRMVYNVISPFIKRELRKRVVLIGGDLSQLHEYINPLILPKLLGGELEDDQCRIDQHILNNLPFLRHERSSTSLRK